MRVQCSASAHLGRGARNLGPERGRELNGQHGIRDRETGAARRASYLGNLGGGWKLQHDRARRARREARRLDNRTIPLPRSPASTSERPRSWRSWLHAISNTGNAVSARGRRSRRRTEELTEIGNEVHRHSIGRPDDPEELVAHPGCQTRHQRPCIAQSGPLALCALDRCMCCVCLGVRCITG